ncbi:MAG: hypothetical protein QOG31_1794 [Thermoplasmata archaeon]|jgi:hypothetical protein|nr:hypothetical protein [Thermoplasmata archaeon]
MMASTRGMRIAGWALSGLAIAFLLFDVAIHVAKERHAVESMVSLGWDPALLPLVGGIEAVCLLLYCIPRTAALGAVLLTGYLGGAIATNLRAATPVFNMVFPVLLGGLLWGGLWLRKGRIRQVMPLLSPADP